MTGIGKIWAKRVLAGTQNAVDCPAEYRNDMLSAVEQIADVSVYKGVVIDCIISSILNKEYPSRQDARDAVGLLYTEGTITQEDITILTAKIDEVYGVV